MSASVTVVLTKGAHTVRAEDARAICEAISAGEKLVRVGVELYPGSDAVHPTTLVVAHIVALAEVQSETEDPLADTNVSRLLDYRAI